MNNADFVSLYTHAEPFDDEHFILKIFEKNKTSGAIPLALDGGMNGSE